MTLPARPATMADDAALSRLGGRAAAAAADLAKLCRPRISVMVLATVAAAAWITAGPELDRGALAVTLLGTLLVAASSSIANQILERHTDRRMPRTAGRPLASGRLGVREAWWMSGVLLVVGLSLTVAAGGVWAAAAALGTWALYVVVYTPLKRVTPLNTAVGAVAGSLPVAIGWCAAGGPERLAAGGIPEAVAVGALATLLYLWQFPHFMAIAWLYRAQYSDAGLRMLPVVDPGGLRTAGQALAASLAMVPVGLLLAVPSASVPLFLVSAAASVAYVAASLRFAVRRDDVAARGLLLVSILVLLSILAAAGACGRPV